MDFNEDDFKRALIAYLDKYGIAALEAMMVNVLGFNLASTTALDDGATRRVYTSPDGATAMFTIMERN